MKAYNIIFNLFGTPLEGESKEELISSLIQKYQGPQGLLDLFLRNLHIIEDTIKDAKILEDGYNTNKQEAAN